MTPVPMWISLLLRLYPRDYRIRHEAELTSAMQACVDRERRSGASRVLTAIRIAIDAITSAAILRRESQRAEHSTLGTTHFAHSTEHGALSTGDPLMQSLLYDVATPSGIYRARRSSARW